MQHLLPPQLLAPTSVTTWAPEPAPTEGLRHHLTDEVKEQMDRRADRMLPLPSGRRTHPHPAIPFRPYMGRTPASYVALFALRDRGQMTQRDFLQVYHDAGASQPRQSRYRKNGTPYESNGKPVMAPFLQNFDIYTDEYTSSADNPVLLPCIRVLRRYKDWNDQRAKIVNSEWPGAPRGGNVLLWIGPTGEAPDWRPEYVIPEDYHAD